MRNIKLVRKLAPHKQKATTMVSLIIGVSLSTFLIAAILQIFIVTKRNHQLTENIAEMNDAMRFAVNSMYNSISYAGARYPSASGLSNFTEVFGTYAGCSGCYIPPPPMVKIAAGGEGLQYSPIIMAQGNNIGTITDCLGAPIAAASTVRTRFSLAAVAGRPGYSLRCDNLDSSGAPIPGSNSYLISDLVERMWVLYGVDSSNVGSVQYYTKTDSVANMQLVRAVRIALLLHTRDNVFNQARVQNFSLWGNVITYNSQKLYRLHIFTVPLNQLPVPLPVPLP